jgi:hypothetical protein
MDVKVLQYEHIQEKQAHQGKAFAHYKKHMVQLKDR